MWRCLNIHNMNTQGEKGVCMITSLYILSSTQNCFIYSMFPFGLFPGVRSLNANISEHSVCSIFIGDSPMNIKQTKCSETLAFKLQTLGNNPKENIWQLKYSKNLKSRILHLYLISCWRPTINLTMRIDEINHTQCTLCDNLFYGN
jgi:hypothetical protein